jgi:hypothetical protein
MPNPWVSLRRDQLIPVNKAVNEKEQLEKGLEEEEKKNFLLELSFNSNILTNFSSRPDVDSAKHPFDCSTSRINITKSS